MIGEKSAILDGCGTKGQIWQSKEKGRIKEICPTGQKKKNEFEEGGNLFACPRFPTHCAQSSQSGKHAALPSCQRPMSIWRGLSIFTHRVHSLLEYPQLVHPQLDYPQLEYPHLDWSDIDIGLGWFRWEFDSPLPLLDLPSGLDKEDRGTWIICLEFHICLPLEKFSSKNTFGKELGLDYFCELWIWGRWRWKFWGSWCALQGCRGSPGARRALTFHMRSSSAHWRRTPWRARNRPERGTFCHIWSGVINLGG